MCQSKLKQLKVGIALACALLLLVLMAWVPGVAADTYEDLLASRFAGPGTVTIQATPTVDPTITAKTAQEQLTKLQRENERSPQAWFWNSSGFIGSIVAALLAVGGVLWTAIVAQNKNLADSKAERDRLNTEQQHWSDDRENEQEKRAEERFQKVVEGFGSEREEAKVGSAIMLRTFLQKGYEKFHIQTFDLAVASLRLQRTSKPLEDPDDLPHLSEGTKDPLPLTTLNQALIAVFKEAFPLARSQALARSQNEGKPLQQDGGDIQLLLRAYLSQDQSLDERDIQRVYQLQSQLDERDIQGLYQLQSQGIDVQRLVKTFLHQVQSLDASSVHLDNAYLWGADLRMVWMPQASLRKADLSSADLTGAHLSRANFSNAILYEAILDRARLDEAILFESFLNKAHLRQANLNKADLRRVGLNKADLRNAILSSSKLFQAQLNSANLSEADLSEADLRQANLRQANLRQAKLSWADLSEADLSEADLRNAILSSSKLTFLADLGLNKADFPNLKETDFVGVNIEEALSLKGTDLRGATGLDKKQLAVCKAKGAIID